MAIMTADTLRERQHSILDALVREHVRTARPVASQEIAHHFGKKLSSATIRNEMLELDESGYLEQPYTSAGRIPSDKGYRFFVDHLGEIGLSGRDQSAIKRIFQADGEDEFLRELGKTFARLSGAYTAVGIDEDSLFYETGFSEVLDEPEFRDPEYVRVFGRLIDFLDEQIASLAADFDEGRERVFIGKENPLREGRFYSMVISSWKHPAGFSGHLTMVGPKRMDYEKMFSLIRYLREIAER